MGVEPSQRAIREVTGVEDSLCGTPPTSSGSGDNEGDSRQTSADDSGLQVFHPVRSPAEEKVLLGELHLRRLKVRKSRQGRVDNPVGNPPVQPSGGQILPGGFGIGQEEVGVSDGTDESGDDPSVAPGEIFGEVERGQVVKGEKGATASDPSGESVSRGVVESDTETPEERREEETVQPTDHPPRPRVKESLGGELLRRRIEKKEAAPTPPLQAPKKGKGVTADPPQLRGCLDGASIDEKGHFSVGRAEALPTLIA